MGFVGGLRDGAERLPLDAVNSQLGPNRGTIVTAVCPQGHTHQALLLRNGRGTGVLLQCHPDWLVADVPRDYALLHADDRPHLQFMRLTDSSVPPHEVALVLGVGLSPEPSPELRVAQIRYFKKLRPMLIWSGIAAVVAIIAMFVTASSVAWANDAWIGLWTWTAILGWATAFSLFVLYFAMRARGAHPD